MRTQHSQEREDAIKLLVSRASYTGCNLQMPGDGRYQPKELKPYLGYDQWARWLIIVEWFWMKTLAIIEAMPSQDATLRQMDLEQLLDSINTTKQDEEEKKTKHDILALLNLMRPYLPGPNCRKWLHFCATSYDIINTAYALQLKTMFENVFVPKLRQLDELWRNKIGENAAILQSGRTHLQTALPITVGFWLANLHNRFTNSARKAILLADEITGKFTGAVGTSASQRVLIKSRNGEKVLMEMLGLTAAEISTQITPPESMARFYNELELLSGTLANLGEDARILQSSQFEELVSESSGSSAMSHKKANPIAAENLCGMHATVIAERLKISMTLVSELQRDLRWSNVMRSYSAIAVYLYQQLLTAERLFKSMMIDKDQCRKNFNRQGKLVVAELLHLALQREGVSDAHEIVNKKIVPLAAESGDNLYEVLWKYAGNYFGITEKALNKIDCDNEIIFYLTHPEEYLGDAIEIATKETENKL